MRFEGVPRVAYTCPFRLKLMTLDRNLISSAQWIVGLHPIEPTRPTESINERLIKSDVTMRVLVWDWPTRLFHWLLVCTVGLSLITGIVGGNWIEWHGRLGLLIIGLLSFRVVWGLVGTRYARFSSFIPTPRRLRDYFSGRWQGLGHSPLGGLSVFALLGLLSWQAGSGLFSNDDIAFNGPLYSLLEKTTSDLLSSLHRQGLWWLGGLIGLHIGAVMFYRWFLGKDLIKPMLNGHKSTDDPTNQAAVTRWPALLFALLCAVGLAWVAAGGLLAPAAPPPPPPAW